MPADASRWSPCRAVACLIAPTPAHERSTHVPLTSVLAASPGARAGRSARTRRARAHRVLRSRDGRGPIGGLSQFCQFMSHFLSVTLLTVTGLQDHTARTAHAKLPRRHASSRQRKTNGEMLIGLTAVCAAAGRGPATAIVCRQCRLRSSNMRMYRPSASCRCCRRRPRVGRVGRVGCRRRPVPCARQQARASAGTHGVTCVPPPRCRLGAGRLRGWTRGA